MNHKISTVVSGFHLYNPILKKYEKESLIKEIASKLKEHETDYYTCHCTGIKGFQILKEDMEDKIQYIATGDMIEL